MSDPTVQIDYEDKPQRGRYVARVSGRPGEGELTVSKVSDSLIIADHTFVPEELRGAGVAQALVERLIADARARKQRIVPLCPFVRAQAQRHPEWADVIQT